MAKTKNTKKKPSAPPPGPLLAPKVPQMCPATPPTPPVRVHGIPGPCQIHTCETFLQNTEYLGMPSKKKSPYGGTLSQLGGEGVRKTLKCPYLKAI